MIMNERLTPDRLKRIFYEGLDDVSESARLQFSVPIYALSVPELRAGAGVLRPRAVGWNFLAVDSTGGAVAGEVPNEPDDPGSSQRITTSLSYGLLLDAAREAYGQVIEHPELKDETMEIRRLRIGGLRIEAFWLKAAPFDDQLGENDRVYAFLSFHPELKNKLVQRDVFLKIVRGLAAKSARIDNKPRLSRR
jgi:hypothetical protein